MIKDTKLSMLYSYFYNQLDRDGNREWEEYRDIKLQQLKQKLEKLEELELKNKEYNKLLVQNSVCPKQFQSYKSYAKKCDLDCKKCWNKIISKKIKL